MTEITCSIKDCDGKAVAREWCSKHYQRWQKWGDPTYILEFPDECTVEGCAKPVKTLGLCPGHRQRLSRYGSPTGKPLTPTVAERFWKSVSEADNGCWLWTGQTQVGGYGKFSEGGKSVLAHRWSYMHLVGEVPTELQLDHLCNTTSCVNPYHLDPVTAAVNSQRRNARNLIT